jgi:hypothetical protein
MSTIFCDIGVIPEIKKISVLKSVGTKTSRTRATFIRNRLERFTCMLGSAMQ